MSILHRYLLALAIDDASSRRLTEIGLIVAAIGGLLLLLGWVPAIKRLAIPLAGLGIAVGLVLVLIAVHFGVSPYRHGK